MNILVVLRVGRDPASFTVNRKAEKIFVHRDEWRTNSADLNALEVALQLGDQGHAVIAVAGGGEEAQAALYQARAMGAARAVWANVSALREADAGPRIAIIQRVIDHVGGVGLVLLGATVRHADLAQTGPRLAAALGWPYVEDTLSAQLNADASTVDVTVPIDGQFGVERASTPAVVAIATDSNKPRYAPAPHIIRVYGEAGAVEPLTASDLGLDKSALAPQVTRRGERYPAERTLGQVIEGSPEDLAWELLKALRA